MGKRKVNDYRQRSILKKCPYLGQVIMGKNGGDPIRIKIHVNLISMNLKVVSTNLDADRTDPNEHQTLMGWVGMA